MTVNAATTLATLSDQIYGQNMVVWDGTANGSDAAFNQAVSMMKATQMRFPGGGYGDLVDWSNIACGTLNWLPINMQKAITFAKATNTQLQPIVNYPGYWCNTSYGHSAAVSKAVDWVNYMNVTGGGAMKCTNWEIGNETFGSGEQGFTSDDSAGGAIYGNNFADFYTAMKAADSTIQIGAQCQFDHTGFSQGALQAVSVLGVAPDFLISHAYPMWVAGRNPSDAPSSNPALYASNPYIDGCILDNADLPTTLTAQMDSLVSSNLGSSYVGKIPYWMTEYRSTTTFKFDEFVDAMFCAQFLLELGNLGWHGANIWDLKNGYDTATGTDMGLFRSGANASNPDDNPKDGPRPTYYIYPYLSGVFGHTLVQCIVPSYADISSTWNNADTTGNKVRGWASKDSSGNLTLFLANNNWASAATVVINLTGFTAGATGQMWTFQSSGNTYAGAATPLAQRLHIAINGTEDPSVSSLPGNGQVLSTGDDFAVTMAELSMALVKVPVYVPPTATPTGTWTTPTFTPTMTPTEVMTCDPRLSANRFNPTTGPTLGIYLRCGGFPAKVLVFNQVGTIIRHLRDGEASYDSVPWDGRDDSGAVVSNGLYIVVVDQKGRRTDLKVLAVKR
jgi:hypothetical protein